MTENIVVDNPAKHSTPAAEAEIWRNKVQTSQMGRHKIADKKEREREQTNPSSGDYLR